MLLLLRLAQGEGAVFAFLSAVLGEVFDLFPSEFIHIGGDECPKARWQACAKCQAQMASAGLASEAQRQSWFLAQVDAEAIRPSGRRLLGWDEVGGSHTAAVCGGRWRAGGRAAWTRTWRGATWQDSTGRRQG